jgi:hypothetical protein
VASGRRRQRLQLRALDDEPEHDGKFAEEQWLRVEKRPAPEVALACARAKLRV